MRLSRKQLAIYVFSVRYRDISWHGNLICHLQASFILKNDTQAAVKKQFNILSHSNSGSAHVCRMSLGVLVCGGWFPSSYVCWEDLLVCRVLSAALCVKY